MVVFHIKVSLVFHLFQMRSFRAVGKVLLQVDSPFCHPFPPCQSTKGKIEAVIGPRTIIRWPDPCLIHHRTPQGRSVAPAAVPGTRRSGCESIYVCESDICRLTGGMRQVFNAEAAACV